MSPRRNHNKSIKRAIRRRAEPGGSPYRPVPAFGVIDNGASVGNRASMTVHSDEEREELDHASAVCLTELPTEAPAVRPLQSDQGSFTGGSMSNGFWIEGGRAVSSEDEATPLIQGHRDAIIEIDEPSEETIEEYRQRARKEYENQSLLAKIWDQLYPLLPFFSFAGFFTLIMVAYYGVMEHGGVELMEAMPSDVLKNRFGIPPFDPALNRTLTLKEYDHLHGGPGWLFGEAASGAADMSMYGLSLSAVNTTQGLDVSFDIPSDDLPYSLVLGSAWGLQATYWAALFLTARKRALEGRPDRRWIAQMRAFLRELGRLIVNERPVSILISVVTMGTLAGYHVRASQVAALLNKHASDIFVETNNPGGTLLPSGEYVPPGLELEMILLYALRRLGVGIDVLLKILTGEAALVLGGQMYFLGRRHNAAEMTALKEELKRYRSEEAEAIQTVVREEVQAMEAREEVLSASFNTLHVSQRPEASTLAMEESDEGEEMATLVVPIVNPIKAQLEQFYLQANQVTQADRESDKDFTKEHDACVNACRELFRGQMPVLLNDYVGVASTVTGLAEQYQQLVTRNLPQDRSGVLQLPYQTFKDVSEAFNQLKAVCSQQAVTMTCNNVATMVLPEATQHLFAATTARQVIRLAQQASTQLEADTANLYAEASLLLGALNQMKWNKESDFVNAEQHRAYQHVDALVRALNTAGAVTELERRKHWAQAFGRVCRTEMDSNGSIAQSIMRFKQFCKDVNGYDDAEKQVNKLFDQCEVGQSSILAQGQPRDINVAIKRLQQTLDKMLKQISTEDRHATEQIRAIANLKEMLTGLLYLVSPLDGIGMTVPREQDQEKERGTVVEAKEASDEKLSEQVIALKNLFEKMEKENLQVIGDVLTMPLFAEENQNLAALEAFNILLAGKASDEEGDPDGKGQEGVDDLPRFATDLAREIWKLVAGLFGPQEPSDTAAKLFARAAKNNSDLVKLVLATRATSGQMDAVTVGLSSSQDASMIAIQQAYKKEIEEQVIAYDASLQPQRLKGLAQATTKLLWQDQQGQKPKKEELEQYAKICRGAAATMNRFVTKTYHDSLKGDYKQGFLLLQKRAEECAGMCDRLVMHIEEGRKKRESIAAQRKVLAEKSAQLDEHAAPKQVDPLLALLSEEQVAQLLGACQDQALLTFAVEAVRAALCEQQQTTVVVSQDDQAYNLYALLRHAQAAARILLSIASEKHQALATELFRKTRGHISSIITSFEESVWKSQKEKAICRVAEVYCHKMVEHDQTAEAFVVQVRAAFNDEATALPDVPNDMEDLFLETLLSQLHAVMTDFKAARYGAQAAKQIDDVPEFLKVELKPTPQKPAPVKRQLSVTLPANVNSARRRFEEQAQQAPVGPGALHQKPKAVVQQAEEVQVVSRSPSPVDSNRS